MQVGNIQQLTNDPNRIKIYDTRPFPDKVVLTGQTVIVKTAAQQAQRPSWDQFFMEAAAHVSSRATCPRASVGCVMVRDNLQLVHGFNGAPRGANHCTDVGCMVESSHCIRSLHAEQNAIIQAARTGVSLVGATCYVTHHPCALCANMLINVGIIRVVYLNMYPPADGGEFLRQAGVIVERLEL
jgi:dCMP deaminase